MNAKRPTKSRRHVADELRSSSLRRLAMPRKRSPRAARTKDAVGGGGVGGVVPLRWVPHHVKDNGCYGVTATGYDACYVYQPFDNRIRRGPMPWQVHCYFGGPENPVKGTARYGRFPSVRAAKSAAQKWWRAQVLSLVGVGPEADKSARRTKNGAQGHSGELSSGGKAL